MHQFSIPTIPNPLQWQNPPVSWEVQTGGRLIIEAGPKTDLFSDPAGGLPLNSAPTALFRPLDESFTLSAEVSVEFASTFDAGVLLIWISESRWAKLCFEYSPLGQPMIVSVVNRDVSDDCNSCLIGSREVTLRLLQKAAVFAFHYSEGGRPWNLVRTFSLGSPADLKAGFSAQAPTGNGCRAYFSKIKYRSEVVSDFRSGE